MPPETDIRDRGTNLLGLDESASPEENVARLRLDALRVHQAQMGRGDELVLILRQTLAQMERTHSRVQNMNATIFLAGLIVFGIGVYEAVVQGEVWGTVIGGAGGLAAFAAAFWTAPLDKMAESIRDLVKLEAAFLGYIRVIGEVDSAFQMQYLDILSKDDRNLTIDAVINETTTQMKDMMEHTIKLIDAYVGGNGQLGETAERVKAIEGRLAQLEKRGAE